MISIAVSAVEYTSWFQTVDDFLLMTKSIYRQYRI